VNASLTVGVNLDETLGMQRLVQKAWLRARRGVHWLWVWGGGLGPEIISSSRVYSTLWS